MTCTYVYMCSVFSYVLQARTYTIRTNLRMHSCTQDTYSRMCEYASHTLVHIHVLCVHTCTDARMRARPPTRVGRGACKCLGALQSFVPPLQVRCKCLVSPLSPISKCLHLRGVDALGLSRTYWTYKVLAWLVKDLHCPCTRVANPVSAYKVPCPP